MMPTPPDPQPQPPPPDDTAALLEYLQTHDALCPLCKYNLRNLTRPRCPECGRDIQLTVGLTEPFLLPWILTTIFVAMAAGIGIVFILGSIAHGPPSLDGIPLFACFDLSYALLAIPLTFGLIGARRNFLKLSRTTQVGIAVTAFAINAILLIGTFATVR